MPPAQGGRFAGVAVPDGAAVIRGQRLVVDARQQRIAGRVIGGDGNPVPDAIVRAAETGIDRTPANAPWATFPFAITDGNGGFELTLWDGHYDLHVKAPGGGEAIERGVRGGASGLLIRVETPGRIEGEVSGFARPPAVRARRIGDASARLVAVEAGRFALGGLSAGRYWVWAYATDGGAAAEVAVEAGATVRVTLANRGTGRVEGRVIDFLSGEPVAGVECQAGPYVGGTLRRIETAMVTSDGAGRFAIDAPAADAEIYCLAAAYQSGGGVRVRVAAGEAAAVTVPVVVSRKRRAPTSVGLRLAQWDWSRQVTEVLPGMSAEAGGVAVGDVIAAVDGRSVEALTGWGLRALIGEREIGERVTLRLQRGAAAREVTLTVDGPLW